MRQNAVATDFVTSDSWVILSPIEQSIKCKIEAVGTPLKDWDIQINYGIKTGYNEAFIITTGGSYLKVGQACNDCLGVSEFDWFGGIAAYGLKPFRPYFDFYGCY